MLIFAVIVSVCATVQCVNSLLSGPQSSMLASPASTYQLHWKTKPLLRVVGLAVFRYGTCYCLHTKQHACREKAATPQLQTTAVA
jgi:hypothetical protein